MTEALKSLYVPEDTVAAISAGDKLKEAFSEVTVSGDYEIENVEAFIVDIAKGSFNTLKSNSEDKKPWRQSFFLHRHDIAS